MPAYAADDDAKPACDRACLEKFVKTYLTALTSHDPSRAPLKDNLKYTENQSRLPIGEGLWKTAERLGDYQIYISDMRTSQAVYMGNIKTSEGWSMLTVRLRIVGDKISEVETIYPGPAIGGSYDLGNAPATLGKSRAALSAPLKAIERRDRWQLIQAADLHYEGIERGSGDLVPFGERCIKIENGVQLIKNPNFESPVRSPMGTKLPNFQSMGCTEQFNTHVWDTDTITDRRYSVVDEERGIVVAFAMYNQYAKGPCSMVVDYGPACPNSIVPPYSLAIAEAFRVRSGFIEEVESIFKVLPEQRLRGIW
ncbi:hypothetical protein [Sphingobium nicotianae]|uniref:DUF8021 domain-containing protein n=1 Tax=Sphingobium nicotianae TaxID=2782607 RepID=A0A9X1D9W1_9SPHN|nr:hypothetical protein [Sphingobium nicotianae]MBT2186069.1 hypothetical protein [Sphingobium nicotianae]